MTDARSRQRVPDWDVFRRRARILDGIRRFFDRNDFLEIEAPILIPFPTLDPHILSLKTQLHIRGSRCTFFMHTSPESAMKQCLSWGAEKIYYLGKVFRDDELTVSHNPEFTMLEWYRTKADYHDIRDDTERLIEYIIKHTLEGNPVVTYGEHQIDLTPPWDVVRLRDLFLNMTGVDLQLNDSLDTLRAAASMHGLRDVEHLDWDTLFFRLFIDLIEPHLGFTKPVFIIDYPYRMGLMAKRKTGDPGWVERVELYIAGLEMANGYSELLDAVEQEQRMDAEIEKRMAAGLTSGPKDIELLSALMKDIPPSSGIALGVDRLVMLLTGKSDIRDVILFPHEGWIRNDPEN